MWRPPVPHPAPAVKRSRAVPLTLVASATSLAACGGQEAESLACVERGSNRVVAESLCTAANAPTVNTPASSATPGGIASGTTHAGGIPPIFLWYYGGRALGGMMNGGAYAPLDGRRYRSSGGFAYAPRTGITRSSSRGGGFGSRVGGGTTRGGFGGIGAGRAGGG
jgi:hypothetical protein